MPDDRRQHGTGYGSRVRGHLDAHPGQLSAQWNADDSGGSGDKSVLEAPTDTTAILMTPNFNLKYLLACFCFACFSSAA